jgi:aminomethyltransferase
MTGFGGWELPIRYGSDLEEHHAVRRAAGLFDVSHMGQLEVRGPEAAGVLEDVLVSRVRDLTEGRARYTMLCDTSGRVIDDLIVTRRPDRHTVVANAANTHAVLAALRTACAAAPGASPTEVVLRDDLALLALQGPRAAAILAAAGGTEHDLHPFRAGSDRIDGIDVVVSRTGYTGEDGFELSCRSVDAARLWHALLTAGAPDGLRPCGLAARDTLRLEAGLPLHGHELGADLGPVETGFARIVHLDRPRGFPGRAVLAERLAAGPRVRVVGLVAEGRRAPRAGYPVLLAGETVGHVTSGAPSPTLGAPIALAAIRAELAMPGRAVEVDVRGSSVAARVVDLPFVPRGSGS